VRKHPVLQMLVVGAIGTAIGIAIVLSIPWFPSQASTQAHRVDTLYDVLLIVSVPIFVGVLTIVLYSVWSFRMKPGEEGKDGPPIHGNTRLEIVWTAAPAILIVALCTYAYTVLHANEVTKRGERTVNVIGEQFAWYFAYPSSSPGKSVVTQTLYLAQGEPVVFKIHSRDVIHEFYVPAFREQLAAVPGITSTLRVTPSRLGTYPVVCNQLCGSGHSLMRATLHVLTPTAFQAWLAKQSLVPDPSYSFTPGGSTPVSSPSGSAAAGGAASNGTASAATGKAIFTGSGGCGACHTLAAAGTTGTIGPNLGVRLVPDAKTRGLALPAFINESITKPNAFIAPGYPANVMPQNFSQILTATQIQSLVAYLASVTK
jgi:cytochrome c oxidase subunit 2